MTDAQTQESTTPVTDASSQSTETLLTPNSTEESAKGSEVDSTKGEGEKAPADDAQAGKGDQNSNDIYADLVTPEGVTMDEGLLAEAIPIFKDLGLTKEQAQKLVDFQAKHVQADSQKQIETFNQQLEAWRTQSKNDSEFGGDKFDESVALAQSAVNKFGTPELKQLLNDYGMGNHPEFIRFMFRVGKLTAEDGPQKGSPVAPKVDRVSLLYPNDSNNKS